jgi:hypothetical protein
MVAQVPAKQTTNHNVPAPSGDGPSSINILMADSIDLTTQTKSYEKRLEGEPSAIVGSPPMQQSNGPLTFDKPTFDAPSCPSKGALRRTTHNLNAQASQHYNIIEDLSQDPCAMWALEVLQSFPAQWKSLLNVIGAIDSTKSILFFDTENSEPRLPHTIALQIYVSCLGKNVHRTVLDEDVATCIMSLSSWQDLSSPTLTTSKTVLKAFYGHLFTPHRILVAFPIELGSKIVTIEVEVVNAPLDYNLLLGRSWFYPMKVVASTVY